MNRTTATLRVRWAGPAVLSVLIALAVTPRTAIAAAPPPPSPAAATATVATAKLCYAEAAAYIVLQQPPGRHRAGDHGRRPAPG